MIVGTISFALYLYCSGGSPVSSIVALGFGDRKMKDVGSCWLKELDQFQILCNSRMKGVFSKETVVLRRWGSSIQKFGFINGVDNVNWPPYRDSKS